MRCSGVRGSAVGVNTSQASSKPWASSTARAIANKGSGRGRGEAGFINLGAAKDFEQTA